MTDDPDLNQSCEDMLSSAIRLRHLQGIFARMDAVRDYGTLAMRKAELADVEEEFRTRGETLRMHPDRRIAGKALLLVVEHSERLRRKMRRKPTGPQLTHAVKMMVEATELAMTEATAELTLARYSAAYATQQATASAAALAYIEASR